MRSEEIAFVSAILLCGTFWLILQAVGGPLIYK